MSRMVRRAILLALSLAAIALPAAAQLRGTTPSPAQDAATAPAPVQLEGAARDQALTQANRALNALQTLQGHFVQTSPAGRTSGAFYLQRPGKLRFEYDPPATMLIVSDGRVVAMRDRALRTTQRTPLNSTPLNLILRAQIDLARDARIIRVVRQGDALFVTAHDRSGQTNGELTMRLDGPALQLSSWDVVDATGARTHIALTGVSSPASLDRRLFQLEDVTEHPSNAPH
ncbi:MAG: outer membrane lipoprotein carrier protein LolA [Pseudomonadota bacterium]